MGLIAWAAPDPGADFEAKGRVENVFQLPRFGRYAFEVKSEVGTTLQVVDRMEGPLPRTGRLGEVDGRFDGFFEVGEVKVRLEAPSDGRGRAVVTATPFEEIGTDEALLRGQPVITELVDRVARGWWIEVGAEAVQLEVVGRYLGDVRLWRQGSWLVDATPACGSIDPVDGQPLQRCVLATKLEPGLYRVVAYGGPGAPWAVDAPDDFLSVRWDAPVLPGAGVRTGRIGPTGTDVFRLLGEPTLAHLTLPDIQPAGIGLQRGSDTNLFAGSTSARITDEARIPEVTARGAGANQVLTVSGTPGQPYELRWFPTHGGRLTAKGSGKTLITSVSTARASDTLPPSAIFFRNLADGASVLSQAAGLELRSGSVYAKRFNLLAPTSLYVELDEALDVRFELTEGKGQIRFERVLLGSTSGTRQPDAREGIWKDKHPAGTYLLTLIPAEPGIVTLEAASNGWSDLALASTPITLRPGLREVIELDEGAPLQILVTQPPGAEIGLLQRALPLDPRQAVPLPLDAGERFVLAVEVDEPTRVRATLPNGERLPLELLGKTATEIELPRGSFALTVHNDTAAPVVAVLDEVPPRPEPARIPGERLTALPSFEKLSFAAPAYLDLERGRSTTLQLEVENDGLYALRSTGLLATRGQVRSRVRTDLGRADQNGAGRNFSLDRYLRSGTYQVSVTTLGSSEGHLGIELAAAPLREEGDLLDGQIARATVLAGEGLRYHFDVPERGRVTLRSRAPGQIFPCRLEDEQGWPVVRPNQNCNLDVTLDPGRYVLVSLPSSVETKRHTSFTLDHADTGFEGHGPHPLTLGRTARHTWVEPAGRGERPIDTWTFHLPAALEVTVDPGEEMAGGLVRDGRVLQRLAPGRTWSGTLEAGDYTLELRAARQGTGVRYGVRVSTRELTVGQERTVQLPTTLPLVVGTSGLVTVHSRGDADARARLVGPDGTVTANDDRPDDWNFLIERWLEPGTYQLELATVGNGGRSTTVVVEAPTENPGPSFDVNGKPLDVAHSGQPTVHPLELGARKTSILAELTAPQNLSVSLEEQLPSGDWSSLGTATGKEVALFARRTSGRPLRLRLRSLDGRPGNASLTLSTINPKSPSQESLAAGLDFGRSRWGALDGGRVPPGLYRVLSDRSTLRVCRASGRPCQPAQGVVSLDEDVVIFGAEVRLERADLAGEPVPVELTAAPSRVETGLSGMVAVQLRSASGNAGVQLDDGATALSDEGSLALGKGTARVWGEGVGRLRAVALTSERRDWDGSGSLEILLPAQTVVRLPASENGRYPIALEAGLVARSGTSMLWADRGSVRGFLVADGALELANPTAAPALAVLDPSLAEAAGPEHFAAAAAIEVREIPKSAGRLHVAGASLTYLRRDGRVLRGTDLEIGPGGTAWVQHGLGWHALWDDARGPGPWSEEGTTPATLAFGVTRLEADGPYALYLPEQGRVVWKPDGTPTEVLSNGGDVQVRGLDGRAVQTQARSLPVATLGEGLGPEVLLDGAASAWFRFAIAEAGPIGFGVRAAADRVTATLIAADGREVASGVVGRVELTPGVWYLRLSQAPDASPVRVRPALAGIERPDTGPPEDVVKTYLTRAAAGGTP